MPSTDRQRHLPLPYRADASITFAAIRHLPAAILLDSGSGTADAGRFDIMAAAPDPDRSASLGPCPDARQVAQFFDRLNAIHRDVACTQAHDTFDLPFRGGLMGYLGYDAGLPLHGLRAPREDASQTALPAGQVGYYRWAIVQDHRHQTSALVADDSVPDAELRDILHRVNRAQQPCAPFELLSTFSSNLQAADYAEAFRAVNGYLHAGDCYQVNLAQRFRAAYRGDPFSAYRALRPLAAAAFAGYLDIDSNRALLCLSPERFISLSGRDVSTQPIKGTRPRSTDPLRDREIARELQGSSKDLAENLMIVDLLRNDLGRNCDTGSIRVESLFALHSYPTVHHLVSTISGRLQQGRTAIDLLRDSFPGGSITGAPKRRSMQIIAELEPDAREAYCGSLFYLCNSGRMDSNITIRTLVARNDTLLCWAGGGLVADSRCSDEYQETFDKVGPFLRSLEAGSQSKVPH
ncbi:aminodeoxychorismate synthase component I [Chromatocurvus halotolerans]|uniref:aminodeoxychorismate synthase n=1 Tax=Chromatocurvus halotolerans TaxID=1132028 RepID=A0A4R2LG54_9GAMM|nr:aminodeoxychorismate synthase component I [Chromatocurvus halotolerans]TCO78275.1 aminodeoxychorismate synthase subunit I [Chromatocurvus halotolerans]